AISAERLAGGERVQLELEFVPGLGLPATDELAALVVHDLDHTTPAIESIHAALQQHGLIARDHFSEGEFASLDTVEADPNARAGFATEHLLHLGDRLVARVTPQGGTTERMTLGGGVPDPACIRSETRDRHLHRLGCERMSGLDQRRDGVLHD